MAVTQTDSGFTGGTVPNATEFQSDVVFDQDVTIAGTLTYGTLAITNAAISGYATIGTYLAVGSSSTSYLSVTNSTASTNTRLSYFYMPSLGAANYVTSSVGISDALCASIQYINSTTPYTYISTNQNTLGIPTNYLRIDNSGNCTATGAITASNFQVSAGSQSTFSTAGGISGTSSPLRVINTYSGGDCYVYAGYATSLINGSYANFFMGKATNQALRLAYTPGPTEYAYITQGSDSQSGIPTNYVRFDSTMGLVSTSSATFASASTALTLTNTSSETNVTIQTSYCASLGNSNYVASRLGISDVSCASYKYFTNGTNSYLYLSVDQNTEGIPTNYVRIDEKGSIVSTGNMSITYTGTIFSIASIDSLTNGTIGTFYTSSLGTANYTGIKLGVSAASSTSIQYINSATPYTYISTNQNTTGAPTSYLRIDNSGNLTTTGLLSRTLTSAAGTAVEATTNNNSAGTSSIYFTYTQPNLTTGDTIRWFIGKDTGTNYVLGTWTQGANAAAHTYALNMGGFGGLTLGGNGQATISSSSVQPLAINQNTLTTSGTMFSGYQPSLATGNTSTMYLGVSGSYATKIIYTHQTTSAATTTLSMPQGSGSVTLSAAGDFTVKGSSGTQTFKVDSTGAINNIASVGATGNASNPGIGSYYDNSWVPTVTQLTGTTYSATSVKRAVWKRNTNGIDFAVWLQITQGTVSAAEQQSFTLSVPVSTTFSSVYKAYGEVRVDPTTVTTAQSVLFAGVVKSKTNNTLECDITVPVLTAGNIIVLIRGTYEVI